MINQALQLTSLFEHGTPTLQYETCEQLGDGRGWTCGIFGYTNEEDVYFLKYFSGAEWREPRFDLKWKKACRSSVFCEAQRVVAQVVFGNPALAQYRLKGCVHNLTLAAFFDTAIQHGDGNDPDSFQAVLKGWVPKRSEAANLRDFLLRRKAILMNPHNEETQSVWRESAGRVDAFLYLLGEEVDGQKGRPQLDLSYPIKIVTDEYVLTIRQEIKL